MAGGSAKSTSSHRRSLAALLAATIYSLGTRAACAAEDAVVDPPPAVDEA
ncbi:peptide-methionine (S)-S-oxide reductase, partial [Rhizobium brockwellii]